MKYPKHFYERDPEVLHLYIKDIRILTPKEYDILKTAISKEAHKTILDIQKTLERTIYPLPSMFSNLLQDFWQANRPPLETTWNKNLQRWAAAADINPYGLSVKTTRKTLESWMIAAGIIESAVCIRQGNDSLTSMKHYQGLVFPEDELRDIKKKLTSWGIKVTTKR